MCMCTYSINQLLPYKKYSLPPNFLTLFYILDAYPHNRDCTWTVFAPTGNRVNLTFSHFDVEDPHTNGTCLYDYVQIAEKDVEDVRYLSSMSKQFRMELSLLLVKLVKVRSEKSWRLWFPFLTTSAIGFVKWVFICNKKGIQWYQFDQQKMTEAYIDRVPSFDYN